MDRQRREALLEGGPEFGAPFKEKGRIDPQRFRDPHRVRPGLVYQLQQLGFRFRRKNGAEIAGGQIDIPQDASQAENARVDADARLFQTGVEDVPLLRSRRIQFIPEHILEEEPGGIFAGR